MPGNPDYVIPLKNLLKDGSSSGGTTPIKSYKTLEEIATDNKKSGDYNVDFQDVLNILEGKSDGSLPSV